MLKKYDEYLPSNELQQPIYNYYPPTAEAVLASRIDSEDAAGIMRRMISARELIVVQQERTKRHHDSSLVSLANIQAYKEISIRRIETNHEYRMEKLALKRATMMSRHNLVSSIVQSVLQNSIPRSEVNGIKITESKGRFWSNYDYKFHLEIY